jgi:hypothetical protein
VQSPARKHAQLSAETPDFLARSRVRDCCASVSSSVAVLRRASERATDERQTSDGQLSRRARHDTTTDSPEKERGTQKKELRTVDHFSRLHFFYIRTTLPFDRKGFKPSIQVFFFLCIFSYIFFSVGIYLFLPLVSFSVKPSYYEIINN